MATKRHKPEEIVTKLRQIDGSGGTRPTFKFFEVPSAFCRSELFGHVLVARLAPAIPSRCAVHTSCHPPYMSCRKTETGPTDLDTLHWLARIVARP